MSDRSFSRRGPALRPAVDALEARRLLATFTVTNTLDSGAGSFRQAILSANATSTADVIAFNIPGTGVQTIKPVQTLPSVTSPLSIDGRTQPGWAIGAPRVELDFSQLPLNSGNSQMGLQLLAAGSAVRGLVLNGVQNVALYIGASGAIVQGNFIGTDPTGTVAKPNRTGILASAAATIGGSTAEARNVISGNKYAGILIQAGSGSVAGPVTVLGNAIGTDLAGKLALGNGFAGIESQGRAVIGNGSTGGSNKIMFNGTGVRSIGGFDSVSNDFKPTTLRWNSIFLNKGLGVDVLTDYGRWDVGVTPFFPVLTSAVMGTDQNTIVVGSLTTGKPNTTYAIEFYTSLSTSNNGYGEGDAYRGRMNVLTNASGVATFSFNMGWSSLGRYVTATATDPAGETSEFSRGVPVATTKTGTISGRVFLDTDANGSAGTTETGADGVLVYADLNLNGRFDVNEPGVGTSALDNGTFTLGGLSPGSYTLRLVVPPGYEQTLPASTGARVITVGAGTTTAGVSFGVATTTSSVSGFIFNDLDHDGVRETGEGPSNQVYTVYDDLNLNNVPDTGETYAYVTQGVWTMSGLLPGAHHFRPSLQFNVGVSKPSTGRYDLTLAKRSTLTNLDFGVSTIFADIRGTLFNDLNANGVRDAGEPALLNRAVTLYSGTSPSNLWPVVMTQTDSFGQYAFPQRYGGSYVIRPTETPDWTTTSPASGERAVMLTNWNPVTNVDFGLAAKTPSVSGRVFFDVDRDGVVDIDEPGVFNATVWVDANGDGLLTNGEKLAFTDRSGLYTFGSMPVGTPQQLRVQLPTGLAATTPVPRNVQLSAGQRLTGANFGLRSLGSATGSITGVAYFDTNKNGVRDSGEKPAVGVKIFLDTDGDKLDDANEAAFITDEAGRYAFDALPAGTYRVTFNRNLATVALNDPTRAISTVTLTTGQHAANIEFPLRAVTATGTINGVIYGDTNQNGVLDTNEGSQGYFNAFVDLDGDRQRDTDEPFGQSGSSSFVIQNVPDGTVRVLVEPKDGWELSPALNPAGQLVTMVVGQTVSSVGIGLAYKPNSATLRGTLWFDLNQNGLRDDGSVPSELIYVFLDLNNNGVFDSYSERAGSVDAATGAWEIKYVDAGSVTVRVDPTAFFAAKAPADGSYHVTVAPKQVISGLNFDLVVSDFYVNMQFKGQIFYDSDQDGFSDAGEDGLDYAAMYVDLNHNGVLDLNTEPYANSASTLFNGYYSFVLPAAGTYDIRVDVPPGLRFSNGSKKVYTLKVPAYRGIEQINFGLYNVPTLAGRVYQDNNNDGMFNTPWDGYLSTGWRVYVDTNNNNVFNAGEKSVLTDDAGRYLLDNLPAGVPLRLKVVARSGWQQTGPTGGAYVVTLGPAEQQLDLWFGFRPIV